MAREMTCECGRTLVRMSKVTGRKDEPWLVKTVGILIADVGAALLFAGLRGRVSRELRFLAAGSALSLALVDTVYAGARRRISPVYLLDAAAEVALFAGWCASEAEARRATLHLFPLAGAATAALI